MRFSFSLMAVIALLNGLDAPLATAAGADGKCAAMCRNWCAQFGRDQALCNDRCQVRRCQ